MVIKIFQTSLILVWNLRLAKSFFSSQTKLELIWNFYAFLGVIFLNQAAFGLERTLNGCSCRATTPFSEIREQAIVQQPSAQPRQKQDHEFPKML